ncbi:alpha/beta hydrolase [Sporosarcina sp. ACRSM]|uniref:alpha/beta fold hydrolase n=1 Tax=Sporosarcina sp. ACRSM TaxID=2918216 RepID=UPI001EF5F686|nr:alpha/beta hydrolase [Sporosarcina sp. ACRSM]MCG7333763.1 alpha/beta hydrolase [Sporosarcina sp. ACRSM]
MHYVDIGQGDPLVFIHGLGSIKESWQYQYELATHYRLIIPDLRGHGESEEDQAISIAQFAEDVCTLLDRLEIRQAHFCGLSMGGLVVQEIYRQQPDRVQSIILSNTFSYTPYLFGYLSLKERMRNLQLLTLDEYITLTATRCLYEKTPDLIQEAKSMFVIRSEPYIASSQSAIQSNYLPMLPFVKVPTLLIGSLYDEVIPLYSIYQTKWFMPQAEVIIFDKCGHLPNLERKEKYNEILFDFIEESKRKKGTCMHTVLNSFNARTVK